MPMEAMIIIILVGLFAVYLFYLVSIYVKLENRRSLILSKFTEVNNQIDNKLDLTKELTELMDNKELNDIRVELLNSVCVNDRIKYSKILDSILNDIKDDSRKVKKILNSIKLINDKINYSKEFYNDSLYEYNIILSTINGKILKKLFKYTEYNTF